MQKKNNKKKNTLKQEFLINIFWGTKMFFLRIAAKKKKLFRNVYIQEWAFRCNVLKMTTLPYFIWAYFSLFYFIFCFIILNLTVVYFLLIIFNPDLQMITLKWHQGGELMTKFVL